ncbi:TMEM165/GDT1 family protein [archaeon]|nr:MAG: TMEM165/GDT1 family protein [archaeon]
MRSGRLAVYGGAMSALTIMHILSSLMGYALPALIDKRYTHLASAVSMCMRMIFVYGGYDVYEYMVYGMVTGGTYTHLATHLSMCMECLYLRI